MVDRRARRHKGPCHYAPTGRVILKPRDRREVLQVSQPYAQLFRQM